jgi:hypothetical protein
MHVHILGISVCVLEALLCVVGDIFWTGMLNLLTVVEDIDVCRTFAWLPCCDAEYFRGAAMCPLVTRKLCIVADTNSAEFMSICTNSDECTNGMCLNTVA